MCGIVAVTGRDALPTALALQTGIVHRGPDAAGHTDLGECALAMTRLAILDPTPRANQPMESAGRHIVFNGEIYNFRELRHILETEGTVFRTTGDTEVVLESLIRWGPGALPKFRGMFALALWDAPRRQLLIARDRFGIKPLYWVARPGGIAVASETSPLAKQSRAEVAIDGIREFLLTGSPVSRTAYVGIREVEPGTIVTVDAGGAIRASKFEHEPQMPDSQGLGDAFIGSVEAHLISDRPVAVFLSGGFDSAAVVSAISATSSHMPVGITLATPGNDEDVDRARSTARHYNIEQRVVDVRSEEVVTLADQYLQAMDQPTIDGFNTFLVSQAAASQGFPVALTGVGGDEVLGGYGYYRHLRTVGALSSLWRRIPAGLQNPLLRGATSAMRRDPQQVTPILDAVSLGHRHLAWRTLFQPNEVARLTCGPAPESTLWASDPMRNPNAQLRTFDLQTYLRPTLLRDSDVFSMANGVEIRVPFLDSPFLDQIGDPIGKARLAKALNDQWLVDAARRRKLTFALPWNRWLSPVLGAHQAALDEEDPWHGLVDPTEARALMAEDKASPVRSPLRSWALVILAEWLTRAHSGRALRSTKP